MANLVLFLGRAGSTMSNLRSSRSAGRRREGKEASLVAAHLMNDDDDGRESYLSRIRIVAGMCRRVVVSVADKVCRVRPRSLER